MTILFEYDYEMVFYVNFILCHVINTQGEDFMTLIKAGFIIVASLPQWKFNKILELW